MTKIDNILNQFLNEDEKKDEIIKLIGVLSEYIDEKTSEINNEPIMCDINDVMEYCQCGEKQARKIMHDPDLAVFDKGHKLLVEINELKRYLGTKNSPASIRYWNKFKALKGAA